MNPTNELNISESEWEVMRVLWAESPLTSREIINRVLDIQGWKEGTVKSLINRLVNKDNIRKVKTETVLTYEPTIMEHQANYLKVDKMMSAVCTKERGNVISHLIEENNLSQDQIQELVDQLQGKLKTAPLEVKCECLPGQCNCHLHK